MADMMKVGMRESVYPPSDDSFAIADAAMGDIVAGANGDDPMVYAPSIPHYVLIYNRKQPDDLGFRVLTLSSAPSHPGDAVVLRWAAAADTCCAAWYVLSLLIGCMTSESIVLRPALRCFSFFCRRIFSDRLPARSICARIRPSDCSLSHIEQKALKLAECGIDASHLATDINPEAVDATKETLREHGIDGGTCIA